MTLPSRVLSISSLRHPLHCADCATFAHLLCARMELITVAWDHSIPQLYLRWRPTATFLRQTSGALFKGASFIRRTLKFCAPGWRARTQLRTCSEIQATFYERSPSIWAVWHTGICTLSHGWFSMSRRPILLLFVLAYSLCSFASVK